MRRKLFSRRRYQAHHHAHWPLLRYGKPRLDLDLLRLAAIIHDHARAMLYSIEVVLSKRSPLTIHARCTRHCGNTVELHPYLLPPHRIRTLARRNVQRNTATRLLTRVSNPR